MFLGKTTVVYYRNPHHDGVRDILRNTSFYMHCIQGLRIHLCLSIPHIFLKDTFFYLDAISPFRIVKVFCTFFSLLREAIGKAGSLDLKVGCILHSDIKLLQKR